MKILIFALSGIGDALMFTPALSILRQAEPAAEIHALVMFKGVKEMYERNKNIDRVLYFDFLNSGAVSSSKFVLGLRGQYDISINVYPSNRKEYNIISFLTGARIRAGARYLRKDFSELGFLNNRRITENDLVHNVRTNIKIVNLITKINTADEPPLQFYLSQNDENFAEKFLASNNIKSEEIRIGFHPGSATLKNHEKRRWEPEKFAELGRRLIDSYNCKILIFGGPEEKELKEKILKYIGPANALIISAGNLAESAAIIKRCDVFVSNDSSLMHVAAAMQRKVVAIIGPTNPKYIHPWSTEHKIVSLNLDCSPCFIYSPRPLICTRKDVKFKCIKELNIESVYEAVSGFLKG